MNLKIYKIFFLFFCCACNKPLFQGNSPTKDVPSPVVNDSIPVSHINEKFTIAQQKYSPDVVFAIDTSTSMTDEINSVQKNLEAFFGEISQKANARAAILASALYSESSTDIQKVQAATNLLLNSATKLGFKSLQLGVTSHNSLDLFLRVSCNDGSFGGPETGGGALASWYRKESTKVFIVVTDDNATNQNFITTMSKCLSQSKFVVYGFIGVASRQGCAVENRGSEYENLAQQTGGKIFDICEPNWQNSFTMLANHIVTTTTQSFNLKQNPRKILHVLLNDVPTNDFSVDQNIITLKGAVPENTIVTVKYQ